MPVGSKAVLLAAVLVCSWVMCVTPVTIKMTPNDPLIEAGTDATLNCTLDHVDDNCSAKYFEFKLPNQTKMLTTASPLVTVVNDHTAQLSLLNVSRSLDGKHIFCYNDKCDKDNSGGQQVLAVARKPVKPRITNCTVRNWDSMTCYWEPAEQDTGINTTVQLYWSILNSGGRFYPCTEGQPYQGSLDCFKPDSKDRPKDHVPYRMKLRITFWLGEYHNIWSSPYDIHSISLIVKPDPPKEVRVKNYSSTGIELSWKSPRKYKEIRYWITYKSKWDTEERVQNVTVNKVNGEEHTYWVTGLTPNTSYELWITCRPKDGGYDSDKSKKQNTTTKEDVPGAAPELVQGALWISATSGNEMRTVNIHWNDIEEKLKHGNIIRYKLCVPACYKECKEFTPGDSLSYNISVSKNMECQVTLKAGTIVGYNSSLEYKPLLIPRETDMPEQPRHLYAVSSCTGTKKCHVTVAWDARGVEPTDNVTVYYCSGNSNTKKCDRKKNKLYSKTVPITRGNVTIDSIHLVANYIFGAAVIRNSTSGQLSSGMKWISCAHPKDQKPRVPVVTIPEVQKDGSLHISWKTDDCQHVGNVIGGYADQYVIQYCLAEDCPERCEQISSCANPTTVSFNRSEENSYMINSLEGGKTYFVAMRAVSPFNLSSGFSSPPQKYTVSKSGLSKGAVAGISVAALFLFTFMMFGLYYICKRCKQQIHKATNIPYESPREVDIPDIGMENIDLDYVPGMNTCNTESITLTTESRMQSENDHNMQLAYPEKILNGGPYHNNGSISMIKGGSVSTDVGDNSYTTQISDLELENNNTITASRQSPELTHPEIPRIPPPAEGSNRVTPVSSKSGSQSSSQALGSNPQPVSPSSLIAPYPSTNSTVGSEPGSLGFYTKVTGAPDSHTGGHGSSVQSSGATADDKQSPAGGSLNTSLENAEAIGDYVQHGPGLGNNVDYISSQEAVLPTVSRLNSYESQTSDLERSSMSRSNSCEADTAHCSSHRDQVVDLPQTQLQAETAAGSRQSQPWPTSHAALLKPSRDSGYVTGTSGNSPSGSPPKLPTRPHCNGYVTEDQLQQPPAIHIHSH